MKQMVTNSLSEQGKRLRALRKEKGLTITALAERAHVSPNTVRAAERGQPCHRLSLQSIVDVLNADQFTAIYPKAATTRPLLDEDIAIAIRYHDASTLIRNHVAHCLDLREALALKELSGATLALAHQLSQLTGLQRESIVMLIDFYVESNSRHSDSSRRGRQTKADKPKQTLVRHRNSA